MSRLFDGTGDGEDEVKFPVGPAPLTGAAPKGPTEIAFGGDDAFATLEIPETTKAALSPGDDPPAERTGLAAKPSTQLFADDPGPGAPPADPLATIGDPLGTIGGAANALPYEIPDFAKDERDVEAYDDAKRRYIRQQIQSAETAIHSTFAQKRETLSREVKNAKSFEDERRQAAVSATRTYATSYPQRVDRKGVTPPSFWEQVLSFGRAGKLYRGAVLATEALEQLRVAMRKREESLEALEGQMTRAIYLKEEAIKKAIETEAGINEFHERPEVRALYNRTENMRKERADYAKRLERGKVSDEEQRDRAMAEFKLTFTTLPVMGAIIARVARYGRLSYFQLRDLEKKESLLSYDPRLDPLRNSVFDIYSVAGAVAAKVKRNDNGTAFRLADHFKACWRNQDKAEELYSQHRAALREDRGLKAMPPRDEAEVEVLERLANLASLVEGGQSAATSSSRNIPTVPLIQQQRDH